MTHQLVCDTCCQTFTGRSDARYCKRGCYPSRRQRTERGYRRYVDTHCAWCGKMCRRELTRGHQPTCSRLCQTAIREYRRGNISAAWPPTQPCISCGDRYQTRSHAAGLCPSCRPVQIEQPKSPASRFIAARCSDCDTHFVMDKKAGGNASAFANYCSKACQRRSANRRRRAVEHQAPGIWRWIEFIQICMTFGGLCAYCHTRIIGQPEPDHVLPLSRGGTNHLTNILPACKACNSSKRDLTLHEWAVERHRRGQDPVRVSPEEPGPSWRHLMPEEDLGRRSKALVA